LLHFLFLLLLPLAALAQAAPAAGAGERIPIIEEVPYITTPDSVTAAMLDLAGVKAGDHVIDLGSGDGRIVIAAARRGATGLGVEIDARLVEESVANARRAGVAERVRFLEQDLFQTDLASATVVTMYLLPEVNLKLRPALLALKPGTRIVSHDWDMGDWQPDRSLELSVPDKKIGLNKSSRVHFWTIPARVEGLWCGTDGPRRATFRIRQSFQQIAGDIEIDGRPGVAVSGIVNGETLDVLSRSSPGTLRLQWRDGKLGAIAAVGALAQAHGYSWQTGRSSCDGR
jgi:SAM-dependent methyltransferase